MSERKPIRRLPGPPGADDPQTAERARERLRQWRHEQLVEARLRQLLDVPPPADYKRGRDARES